MRLFPGCSTSSPVVRTGAAALVLTAGVAASMPGSAWAQPLPDCPATTLTVSPTSGPAGTSVKVSGTGFSGCLGADVTKLPSATLTVQIVDEPSGDALGSTSTTPLVARVQAAGSVSATVRIPTTTRPITEQIVATSHDRSTDRSYRGVAAFTVTAATATPAGPTGQPHAVPAAPGPTGRVVPRAVPAGGGGTATTSGRPAGELVLFAVIGLAGAALTGTGLHRLKRR